MMVIPDEGISFPPPLRLFNMSGGLSLLVGGNGLCWIMAPNEYMTMWSATNGSIAGQVALVDRDVISTNYFSVVEEMQSPFSSAKLNLYFENRVFDDEKLINRWNGLSLAYSLKGKPLTALRAERIAKQLRFARANVDILYRAYRNTLTNFGTEKNISSEENETYSCFSNDFSIDIAYKLQPLLDSLYALRESFLQFLFEEMYEKKVKIKTSAQFIMSDDRYNLASVMIPAMSQEGKWGCLARLALYRNVFFHYLGTTAGPVGESFCVTETKCIAGKFPSIVYGLEPNVEQLKNIEQGKVFGKNDRYKREEEAKSYMKSTDQIDALDFCISCFRYLASMLQTMSESITLKSEVTKITDSDIIRASITRDGVTTHYERDVAGKLQKLD